MRWVGESLRLSEIKITSIHKSKEFEEVDREQHCWGRTWTLGPLNILIAFLDALTKTWQKATEGRMGLFWLQLAGTQPTMAGTWNWSRCFYSQEAENKQEVEWTQRALGAIPPGDFAYWRLHNLSSHKLGIKCSHTWAYGGGHFTSNYRTQNINLLGSSVFIEVINLKWGS